MARATRYTSPLATVSPLSVAFASSSLVAVAERFDSTGSKVTLRNVDTLESLATFVFESMIVDRVVFSPDDSLLAVHASDEEQVRVVSTTCALTSSSSSSVPSEWSAVIREPLAPLKFVMWAPDSRHLVTMANLNIRLAIWSFTTKQHNKSPVMFIEQPVWLEFGSFSKSSSNFRLAVIEHTCQLSLFDRNFRPLFRYSARRALAKCLFHPDASEQVIAVCTTEFEFVVQLVSTTTGQLLHSISTLDVLSESNLVLGLSDMTFSHLGQVLAVLDSSGSVHLINTLSSHYITSLVPPSIIDEDKSLTRRTAVFQEIEKLSNAEVLINVDQAIIEEWSQANTASMSTPMTTLQVVLKRPIDVHYCDKKVNDSSATNRLSNTQNSLKWSLSSRHLALNLSWMPSLLFVWNVEKLRLSSLLIFKNPVQCFEWASNERLIVATKRCNVLRILTKNMAIVEMPLPTTLVQDNGLRRIKVMSENKKGHSDTNEFALLSGRSFVMAKNVLVKSD